MVRAKHYGVVTGLVPVAQGYPCRAVQEPSRALHRVVSATLDPRDKPGDD
jgi:hypothetical protein